MGSQIITALTLGLLLSTATAQQIQISRENKTIAITTNDQAEALADTAVLTAGFHIYGKDQDGTYAEASRTSNSIISAFMGAGIPKDAIESAGQSLSPLDENSDDDKVRFAQGIRFEFRQSWHVILPAESVAKVLHLAITSGANDSGAITWELRKDNALEAEAAKKALEHAKQIAAQMAAGLGVKLGPLVYASNQTPPRGILAALGYNGAVLNTESASVAASKRNLAPLAISPEKIQKSATVYAVFSIE
ncbi:MAG TPA: SIMPL domain-containing protein [Acidobacteriaceae bacterium]|nr:SIMPL domain-containing protein [Acidobacteriaceae bacterium]